MNKKFFFWLGCLLFLQSSFAQILDNLDKIPLIDSVYDKNIHTVQLHTRIMESNSGPLFQNTKKEVNDPNLNLMPVLPLKSAQKFLLSFDDFITERQFNYTLIHCTSDWQYSDLDPLDYIQTYADQIIRDIDFSIGTVAQYAHHFSVFPNQEFKPVIAGNYVLVVFDPEEDEIAFTKRLAFVADNMSFTSVRAQVARSPKIRTTHQEVTVEVFTDKIKQYNLPQEIKVVVQQNGRWDNARFNIPFSRTAANSLVYDRLGDAVFEAGSEFNMFDISSLTTFGKHIENIRREPNGPFIANVRLDKATPNFYYRDIFDINGGFIIHKAFSNQVPIRADYAKVNFYLEPKRAKYEGKVYIIGAFNNWAINKDNEMRFHPEDGIYRHSMYLKQGYYNYTYVFKPNLEGAKATFSPVTSNFSESTNQYRVYVYHRSNADLLVYDKLIDVITVSTR
jgi:hypothetical protein